MVRGKINQRIVHVASDLLLKTLLEPILDANAATVDHLGDKHFVLHLKFFVDLKMVLNMGQTFC